MKVLQFILIISIVTIIGCNRNEKYQVNHFTSSCDTIVLITEKIKGNDLFPAGAGVIHFFDTTEFYKYPVTFPEDITNIKISYKIIDFKKFDYEAFHNKASWDDPSLKNNSVCVMSGLKGNDTIFIYDENNNKDFSDDSVRLFKKMDWKTTTKLIKSKYLVNNGKEIVEDSTWVNIGTIDGTELWFFVSNHLESSFSIDNKAYQIGVVDEQSQYCFDAPILALISQNGIRKDTLVETELLKKGEYLKLKDTYYRFDTISNDGKYVTLIKEKNFNSIIGTQVGMIAPSFKCKTTEGELIDIDSIEGKILLANISGCTSTSYDKYNQLISAYSDTFYILGIESGISTKIKGKLIDVEDEYNKDVYEKYRRAYSCYDCYLIDADGRIIDKFNIFSWEKNLPGYKK